jgi:hypothetical protein
MLTLAGGGDATMAGVELSEELVQLGLALGVLRLERPEDLASWTLNTAFFADPPATLAGIATDPARRQAAITLAEALLGRAEDTLDRPDLPAGQTWIPLAKRGGDTGSALFAVIDSSKDRVDLGLAGRAGIAHDLTRLTATVSVPVVRVERGAGARLLLGTADGSLRVGVALQLPTVGLGEDLALGGVAVTVVLPTAAGREPSLRVRLRGVKLPGWQVPRDLDLSDDLTTLGGEVLDVLISLLQTRVGLNPATAGKLQPLLTLLGLGDTKTVPPLPVQDLVRRGPVAVADWIRSVFTPQPGEPLPPARARAWLAALAELLGITDTNPVVGTGTAADPYRVCATPVAGVEVCVRLVAEQVEGAASLRLGLVAEAAAGEPPPALPSAVRVEADVLAVMLSASPQVTWLPNVRVEARLGSAATPLVRQPAPPAALNRKVAILRAGIAAGPDHRAVLILDAEDVVLGGRPYPRLDLSSVEALTEAASTVATDALTEALAAFLDEAGSDRRARALLALLGLRAPDNSWPVVLPAVTELVADPAGAWSRYHARVLAASRWETLAGELAALWRATGPTGEGSPAHPWVLLPPLAPPELGAVGARTELLLWRTEPDSAPVLHVAARITLDPIPVAAATLGLTGTVELARLTLPAAAPLGPVVTLLDRVELTARVGDNLVFDGGPTRVEASRVTAAVGWERGASWTGSATVTGAKVTVAGTPVALPDPFELTAGSLPATPAASAVWHALTLLLGQALAGPLDPSRPDLPPRALAAGLLGWLPALAPLQLRLQGDPGPGFDLPDLADAGWPMLSLEDLVTNPTAALRAWLAGLLGATGGTDLSLPTVGLARALLGRLVDDTVDVQTAGSGTHEDPWRLPVGGEDAPALLVWLDPEGPTLAGLGDVVAGLVPDDLTRARDDTAQRSGADRLVEVLRMTARFDPDLDAILSRRDDPAAALLVLRDLVDGTDGLIPAAAQAAPGDITSAAVLDAPHLAAPGAFILANHLPTADPTLAVHVAAPLPGVAPWPGQPTAADPRLIDLRAAGLAPEAFDLGGIATTGPWYVLLPTRAGATTPPLEGLEGVTARLRRAMQAIAARAGAGADLILVAHSVAGHAARAVWAEGLAPRLVTVATPALAASGAPAATVGLDGLARADVGDAVRLLQRLVALLPAPGTPDADLRGLSELLATLAPALGDALPGADGVPARVPFPRDDFASPPLPVAPAGAAAPVAVTARLTGGDLDRGVAALVAATAQRLPGAPGGAARAAVTRLGLGLEVTFPAAGPPGGVQARTSLRLDAHQVRLGGSDQPRRLPRLQVAVAFHREDGWLVGGPGRPASADDPAPRVRWAELRATARPALDDLEVTVVLHDAGLYGVDHGRQEVTGDTLDSAARLLLGGLARALSPAPATGPVRELLDLLAVLGVTSVDAAGMVAFEADALERLLVDPGGFLRARLADGAAQAAAAAGLRRLLSAPTTGPVGSSIGPDLRLEVDPATATLTVATTGAGLSLGGVGNVAGRVSADVSGRVAAELRLRGPHVPGPLGDTELVVDADTTATLPFTVWLDGQTDTGAGGIRLYPAPDIDALGGRLMATVGGELVRIGLEWVRDQGATLDPLLDAVGLLAPGDPPRIRNPRLLLQDPGRWLVSPAVLGATGPPGGQLAPGKVAALVEAVGALLGVSGGLGRLPLTAGAELTVGEDGNDLLVTLIFRKQVTDPAGGLIGPGAGLVVRVAPGPSVTTGLTAAVRRTGTVGLAAAALELDAGATLRLTARLTPIGPGAHELVIPLYPDPPGLGALADLAATATVEYALPALLDTLTVMAASADPQRAAVASAIGGLGTALGLRDAATGKFTPAELRLLAADPAGELAARFRRDPAATTAALRALVQAVTGVPPPAPPALWRSQSGNVKVDLATTATGGPQVTVTAAELFPLLGRDGDRVTGVAADATVTLTDQGLGPSRLAVVVTDPHALLPGPVDLLPFVDVRLGGGMADPDRVELGLWLDPASTSEREAIVLRFPLTGAPVVLRRRTTAARTTDSAGVADAIPKLVQRIVVPLAAELTLLQQTVDGLLATTVGPAGPSQKTVGAVLADADVLTGPPWTLANGLLDELTPRVLRTLVGFLLAAQAPELGPFRLSLLPPVTTAPGMRRYGIGLALTEPLALPPTGGLVLSVDADATWEPQPPTAGAAHLELWIVELPDISTAGTGPTFTPAVRVRGLGVRAEGERGPLLDLGVRVGAVGLHTAYLRDRAGLGHAGASLTVQGLAVPLGAAGGGTNPVAAKILSPGPGAGDQTPPAPIFSPELVVWKQGTAPATVSLRAGLGPSPWWLPIQRSFGPLYIEQVGLDVTQADDAISQVAMLVDGGVALGGLAIGVDDLSLTIPWATAANPLTWRLDLAGLAVAYDAKGIQLAGGLRRRRLPDGGVEYAGMLQVRAAGFGLTAVGAYGEFPIPGTSDRYTSMFVFAALAAPLGGPPAFFVTGVGGGVGVNRALVVPAEMTAVTSFPLVAAMDPGNALLRDPMGALTSLGQAFPPQRGAFWLAAGIRFTSFTVVESIAVLTVAIGDDVEIVLLGLARMGLPNPRTPIVQVELALRARFSAREGVLSVQAQLTDNSWLLNRSCRLTGGFAMVIWLRTGEFVLTLGGYHPRFNRPAHFPVVPRIGICWSVSEAIVVKGEGYFALTGSCVMAGARIEIAFDAGVVQASFVAGIDALISWDPFFYDVSAYVRVSAHLRIEINLGWFGTIRINLGFSIGAEVRVWGPALRGTATLDLDVTQVTVAFGPDDAPNGKEPIGWSVFHDKYLVAGDPAGETMSLAVPAGQIVPDPGAAMREPDDGSAARPFRLLPEFELASTTRTAANRVGTDVLNGPALDLGPMRKVGVSSTHAVEVQPIQPGGALGNPVALPTAPVRGSVPDGVWRVADDTSLGEGGVRPAFTGATVRATATPAGGQAHGTVDQVQTGIAHTLPLRDDRDPGGTLSVAMAAAEAWALTQADLDPLQLAAELFKGTGAAAFARCLSPTAPPGPSAFALALLAADRIAPPRLAQITEALVAPPQPPVPDIPVILHVDPPDPEPPTVEPPRLTAVLRPPAGRRPRDRRTTVSRRDELPRRFPPTLAAARAAAEPLAVQLQLAPPIVGETATGRGIAARDQGRRFARARAATEAGRGLLAPDRSQAWLRSTERQLAAGASAPLAGGQVQVWRLNRAAEDRRAQRPKLRVDGTNAVLVTALDRAGGTLAAATLVSGEIEVPIGAQHLAVVGVGTPPRPRGGLAGWHAGSTAAQVAPDTFLVPSGTVRATAPASLRGRRPARQALVTGAELAHGRGLTQTDLPPDTRCIVIVVGADTAPDLGGLLLGLDGATPVLGADGNAVPPITITQGTRTYLLFAVEPSRTGPVTVTVGRGDQWTLAGVLGAAREPGMVARTLLEQGVDGLTGNLAEPGPASSTLTWIGGP